MAQGDKNKKLNKNKRAFVKSSKPKRGDQQKLRLGRVYIAPKKFQKVSEGVDRSALQKRLLKSAEAMFSSKVAGTGDDLNLKYHEMTPKPKKKGHK
eukprot:CAMPEP_0185181934 /NCGR_PEP_ID=MMETSP1140-20130426/1000_1 /TAXON_ID=298111 /ORGANISM="Pavlova sp., Strain CCMP459" /LENGTH=95 /DNA_ID=CAMNT_0027747841 /DNA_START=18 /DNA_END=305 /DNA_ORIENTATION=+